MMLLITVINNLLILFIVTNNLSLLIYLFYMAFYGFYSPNPRPNPSRRDDGNFFPNLNLNPKPNLFCFFLNSNRNPSP